MRTLTQASEPWSARDVAFILGYADYCIHYDINYPKTVSGELSKISSKSRSSSSIDAKLYRILQDARTTTQKFRRQGVACLELSSIKSDVRTELDRMREEWALPPLPIGADATERNPWPAAAHEDPRADTSDTIVSAVSKDSYVDLRPCRKA